MATPTPRHAVSLCTLLLNSSLPINHPCVYLPRCRCLCTAWIRTRPLLAVFVGVCRSRWWSLQLSRLIGRPPQGTVWHCRSRSTASVSSSPGPFSDAAFVMHVTRMYRRGHFQCARRRVIPPVLEDCSLTRAHGITLFSSTRLRVYIKRPLGSSAFSLGTLSKLRIPASVTPLLNQVPAQRLS